MSYIDLNCDMGEVPGGKDSLDSMILPYVSSVNIACGFHAGDAQRMQHTVEAAIQQQVAIGAHPGFDDKANFGRIEQTTTPKEVYQIVLYQIGALYSFVKAANGKLNHVKPHGALYNMAARDRSLAQAIVDAVHDFDPALILYALDNSEMTHAAKERGMRAANEGFADRHYLDNGLLVSRTQPDAIITDLREAVDQAILMAQKRQIMSINGTLIPCTVDTICIHGDGAHALVFAQQLHQALIQQGITIQSPIRK